MGEFAIPDVPDVPTKVVTGRGTAQRVWEHVAALGGSRPLVVCDRGVHESGLVESIVGAAASDLQVCVFAEVEPDPTDTLIARGGRVAREAQADAIVAIGGGSGLDAGKAIAAEALDEGWIGRQDAPGQPTVAEEGVLPIVACPTTAGTGSEVTPFCVITFTQSERKLVLNNPAFYPRVAVLDPELLPSAPQPVRAAAGMDALTHAVESYTSKQATPETQELARQAIQIIGKYLPRAATDAGDLEAQSAMQAAATIAGLAFSKTRLGIVHAMALPLGALFHVPHGTSNAILLPYGMDFNRPAVEAQYAGIAAALGVDTSGLSGAEASAAAVERVRALGRECHLPQRMRDAGVKAEAIERMAADAIRSAHIAVNPRSIELSDLIDVYGRAF
jgi:alcohol dehydrogenase class IV